MPRGFGFPSPAVQLWVPLRVDPADPVDSWGSGYMPLVARLRPGVTAQQAQGEVRALIARVVTLFPFPMPATWNADAAVIPLQQDMVGDIRGRLLLLLGAVGLVLLVRVQTSPAFWWHGRRSGSARSRFEWHSGRGAAESCASS